MWAAAQKSNSPECGISVMPLLNLAYSSGNEMPQTEVEYQVYKGTQDTHAPPPPTLWSPRGAWSRLRTICLEAKSDNQRMLLPCWGRNDCFDVMQAPRCISTKSTTCSFYWYHLHPLSYGYHLHPQLGPRKTMLDFPFRPSSFFAEVWHSYSGQHILCHWSCRN